MKKGVSKQLSNTSVDKSEARRSKRKTCPRLLLVDFLGGRQGRWKRGKAASLKERKLGKKCPEYHIFEGKGKSSREERKGRKSCLSEEGFRTITPRPYQKPEARFMKRKEKETKKERRSP